MCSLFLASVIFHVVGPPLGGRTREREGSLHRPKGCPGSTMEPFTKPLAPIANIHTSSFIVEKKKPGAPSPRWVMEGRFPILRGPRTNFSPPLARKSSTYRNTYATFYLKNYLYQSWYKTIEKSSYKSSSQILVFQNPWKKIGRFVKLQWIKFCKGILFCTIV